MTARHAASNTQPRQVQRLWMVAAALMAGLLTMVTTIDERMSQPLRDAQLRWLAPKTDPGGVLVVDMDDASLASLQPLFGSWPWGRDVHALIIERLRELGARAISLDVLLADSRAGDEALGFSLARPGAPVVLAAAGVDQSSADARDLALRVVKLAASAGPGAESPLQLPSGAMTRTVVVPAASVWPAPDRPPLMGIITTPIDADGRLRRLPLQIDSLQRQWPMAPWALLQATGDAPARLPALDAEGRVLLTPPGQQGGPPVLPLAALMVRDLGDPQAASLRQMVQDRVVFVGQSALMADAVLTVQGQLSGTRVLAASYAALRDGLTARPEPGWIHIMLLVLAAIPTAWAASRPGVRLWHALAVTVATAGVIGLLGVLAHVAWRMPLNAAAPSMVLMAGLTAMLIRRHREQVAQELRLQQALEIERRTSQVKREFLAQVSHELRTPMNALLGVADLLEDTPLNAKQRSHVRVFRRSGQSLLALINDLLDVSRIESGRVDLDPRPFALDDLLQGISQLLGPRAQAAGLQWRVERAEGLSDVIVGDRRRVEQTLINLVGNAIKFTPRGAVRLRAEPAVEGMIIFAVRDSGIGIAPDRLQAIFEPFEQADRTIGQRYGGSGLGLTITQRLVDAMGGKIRVDSVSGQGSQFSVFLRLPPATAAEIEALKAAPPAASDEPIQTMVEPATAPGDQERPTLRVLLAEDNEVNVYLFKAMLDGFPLAIDVVPDGREALAHLREHRYDIAFIDVQMPYVDGLAVTREWRQQEATRGGGARLPIVALTAQALPEDLMASRDAGCDQHLSKPVTQAQLIEAVKTLVPRDLGQRLGTLSD